MDGPEEWLPPARVQKPAYSPAGYRSLAMSGTTKTPGQMADIIERFLSGSGLYPQEFNDFIDCSLANPKLDAYRQQCEVLHTEFEPRSSQFTLLSLEDRQRQVAAIKEMEQIVAKLRLLEPESESES